MSTGYTDIIGEKRLPKDHPILECLGTLDELNAFLGDAKAALSDKYCAANINEIQKDLLMLMGVLAGAPAPEGGIGADRLDGLIKKLESNLPPVNSFVVPGTNPISAKFHIARTVCRRAERRLISLNSGDETAVIIVPYINRLSKFLFLLAQKESIG